MIELQLKPTIYSYDTCREFVEDLQVGADDLIITNQYIFDPNFKDLGLTCHVLFQEKYGMGEPSDEMAEAIYKDMPKDVKRIIGIGGGTVVATGTPEQVADTPASYTGQYLKKLLAR